MVSIAYFVHRIDPVFFEIGGFKIWWYGLAYSVGFLGIYIWFRQARRRFGWRGAEHLDLALLVAIGTLLFGRAFEIVVYEWPYYAQHAAEMLSFWRGGMASHGVLIGAVAGTWLFCRWHGERLFAIADELVIPGAFFLALGRVANFIEGLIYGTVTDVAWAVQFPGDPAFRHPVALYDSLKNLALVPLLLWIKRRSPAGSGRTFAHFVFWYAFVRALIDFFRDYETTFWGIGTGQYFNALMSAAGIALLCWRYRSSPPATCVGTRGFAVDRGVAAASPVEASVRRMRMLLKYALFIAILLLCLTIQSSWTQGVLQALRAGAR